MPSTKTEIPSEVAFQAAVAKGMFRGLGKSPTQVVIELPMPPSINRLYRSVGGRSILSFDYRRWKAEAGTVLMSKRVPPVSGEVSVLVECKPADKRKRDIDNVGFKAVLDLLVAHKIIEADDSTCVREITAKWVSTGEPCVVTVKQI